MSHYSTFLSIEERMDVSECNVPVLSLIRMVLEWCTVLLVSERTITGCVLRRRLSIQIALLFLSTKTADLPRRSPPLRGSM